MHTTTATINEVPESGIVLTKQEEITIEEPASLITRDLIWTNVEVADRWAAIDFLAAPLLDKGYVRDTYAGAVKEREKSFPTALPTVPVAVAIPHCDISHCLRPAIAVGILKHPIPWIEMATLDSWLDTQVVLLLCITDPEAQVNLLRQVVDFFAAPENLGKILGTTDAEEIKDLLAEGLVESNQGLVESN